MKSQIDFEKVRRDFPALSQQRNGRSPVYFDNACTTLVPFPVIESMDQYYKEFPGCGGERSRHWFAEEVHSRVQGDPESGKPGSREIIKEFIHARSAQEIVFTVNATQAINMVALGFKFQPGDTVIVTDKEHNSNMLPWLRLQERGLIWLEMVKEDRNGRFDMERFQSLLNQYRVKLVSLAFTSNLTGYTIPAADIISMAHNHGACVLLDGAQTVPHQKVDVQALDVDFLAFSIHKMCGPRGVGILYGKKELLQPEAGQEWGIEPVSLGGGTVTDVTGGGYSLLGTPDRFEAGIQNYPGQIASGTAVQYLNQIGLENIGAQEHILNTLLTEELLKRYGETGWFRILGPRNPEERGGILTFEVKRPNAVGISDELNSLSNIMIRDGAFCVHSYLNRLFGPHWAQPKLPSEHRMVYRISLYFYNTPEECRIFVDTLDEVFRERGYI